MSLAGKLIAFVGKQSARRFDAATRDPLRTQTELLLGMVRNNADTEYGRRYDFASIDSIADYQKQVPVITYADIERDMERVVAGEKNTKRVLAVGIEAKRMLGRTPASISIVRPLRDGVVSDFDVTEQMIKYFVQRVHDRVGLVPRPRMLLGIPSGVTEVERRAVRTGASRNGETLVVSGLQGGERLVRNAPAEIADGTAVRERGG